MGGHVSTHYVKLFNYLFVHSQSPLPHYSVKPMKTMIKYIYIYFVFVTGPISGAQQKLSMGQINQRRKCGQDIEVISIFVTRSRQTREGVFEKGVRLL